MSKKKDPCRIAVLALRHSPEVLGIQVDAAGYTSVSKLINALRGQGYAANRELIDSFTENIRFSYSPDHQKIRVDYGHSLGLKLSDMFPCDSEPPAVLYHGTHTDALNGILREGIIRYAYQGKKARDHIFLTESYEIAAQKGGRANRGTPAVLAVDAAAMRRDGFLFYHPKADIWLTDHIPPQYLTLVRNG